VADVALLQDEVAALFEGQRLEDPFPVWNRLREEAPVYDGGDMVVLSRYADIKAMLPDRKRYSAKIWVSGSRPEAILTQLSDDTARMWREMAAYEGMSLSRKDGADHERLRGIAHRVFTPRRVAALEGFIQSEWQRLLDQAAEKETYDHKHMSQTLALRVITHIVGCPDVDSEFLAGLVERVAWFMGASDEEIIRQAYEARTVFTKYVDEVVIGGYRADPDSNEFVRAVMDAEGEENVTALELSAMVSVLLFGGVETTAVLLSTGLLELMRHRDQWEWLCEDPVARVAAAVEELFRYVSPAQFIPRTTAVKFEIEGVNVPVGHTVIGAVAAAHRDPAQYENPEQLDITRGRPHLGLGLGPKFCLGASVVRAEARIALTALAQRYPDLELAVPESQLDWSGGPPPIRSLRELPVALGAPSHAHV
jgi:cytochrome P450